MLTLPIKCTCCVALAFLGALVAPSSESKVYEQPVESRSPLTAALVINEVCVAGSSRVFIEVRNNGTVAQDMSDAALETSQGVISLAQLGTLQSGGYGLVVRGNQSLVGPNVIMVPTPLARHIGDTVVLRIDDTIVDAISYGEQVDTSALYDECVAAGEFGSGDYVKTDSCYKEIVLGRNATSADSDDLLADWCAHGGVDSYAPSPGWSNTNRLDREKDLLWHNQKRLNELLANVLGYSVTDASHTGFVVSGNARTMTHSLMVTHSLLPATTLSGTETVTLVPQGAGSFDLVSAGSYTDGTTTVNVNWVERVRPASDALDVTIALVGARPQDYEFSQEVYVAYTGTWSNCTMTQSRTAKAWDGIKRVTVTTATRAINPNVAEPSDTTFHLSVTGDYPEWHPSIAEYEAWIANGSNGNSPWAPETTQLVTFDGAYVPVAGGFEIQYSNYAADYGNLGRATRTNYVTNLQLTGGTTASCTTQFAHQGSVTTHVTSTAAMSLDVVSLDVSIDASVAVNGVNVGNCSYYVDPIPRVPSAPMPGPETVGGWWDWVVYIGASIVVGAGCFIATAGCATGGAAFTVFTGGVGAPVGAGCYLAAGTSMGLCALEQAAVQRHLYPQ